MTWQHDRGSGRLTDFELSKSRPLTEVLHKVEPAAFRDDMIRTSEDLLDQFPQAPMLRRFKPPTHKPRRPAMRVESVYTVTGRGVGLGVRVAGGHVPSLANFKEQRWLVVRPSDGASWPLKGIETFLRSATRSACSCRSDQRSRRVTSWSLWRRPLTHDDAVSPM